MKSMCKKSCFLLAFIFIFSFNSLFGQSWFVCLGSFKIKQNAQNRVDELQKYNITCFIYETQTEGQLLYRVLFDESYDDRTAARTARNNLEKLAAMNKLGIKGLWICTAEREVFTEILEPELELEEESEFEQESEAESEIEPEPEPEPEIIEPEPVVPKEEPQPIVEPVKEEPKPAIEQPAPKEEKPAPKEEKPAPKAEEPAPKPVQPAPKPTPAKVVSKPASKPASQPKQMSEEEKKAWKENEIKKLRQQYPEQKTVLEFDQPGKHITRVIMNVDNEITVYLKVKHSWGATFFFVEEIGEDLRSIDEVTFNKKTNLQNYGH